MPQPVDHEQPFDRDLLELRIHGVRNTPPHLMLQAPPADVVMCRGDDLAGFSSTSPPTGTHHLEAYTWGRLTRFTGLPALGRIGNSLVRVLWFALAPFGLANTAFWARHHLGTGAGGTEVERARDIVGRGAGAGTIRLLGLLLTLFFTTTTATIAVDMAAARPSALPGVETWTAGARTAVLSLVPVLVVLVLAWLPGPARTRFLPGPRPPDPESGPTAGRPTATGDKPAAVTGPDAGGAGPTPEDGGHPVPLLAHRELWRVGSGTKGLTFLHVAAALAWIGGILAAGRLELVLRAGEDPWTVAPVWAAIGVAALVVAAAAGIRILRSQALEPKAAMPVGHWVLLGAGVAVYAAAAIASVADDTTPIGRAGGAWVATVLSAVLATVLLVILGQSARNAPDDPEARQAIGWAGQGPFVFSCSAVGFAAVLSFSAVQISAWLLGGVAPPMVYTLYGTGFVLLVAATAAVLSVFQVRVWWAGRSVRREELRRVRRLLVADAGRWADAATVRTAAHEVWTSRRITALLRRAELLVLGVALAICGGLVAGVVFGCIWLFLGIDTESGIWTAAHVLGAVGLWFAVLAVVGLVALSSRQEARPAALLWDLMCFLPTQAHPFGPPCYSERVVPEMTGRLVDWFTRTADCAGVAPEGPTPATGPVPGPTPGVRRVVISAHSMGLVLTLCVLFQLGPRGLPEAALKRIGLVSYGVQVRRYFSRFFPQVLGPQVLSTVPSPAPDAAARDPWPPFVDGEVEAERDAGWTPEPGTPGPVPGALWAILGDRWINLYRPNDPLGFPVRYGTTWPADHMDRRTEEYLQGAYQFTVATHGGYLESPRHAEAVAAVIDRLKSPPVMHPSPGPRSAPDVHD
jgi:hypothetical protein